MCEFLSWKEKEGEKPLFLDDDDLASKRGCELKAYLGSAFDEDKKGHGAITWWYPSSKGWMHRECEDFSDPKNFPPEIVEKIKLGKFSQFGVCEKILNKYGKAELQKFQEADKAWQEADKAWQEADKAWQEADKAWQEAYKAWQEADKAWQEAYKARQEADKAWKEAYKARQEADKAVFWKIAVQKKYRVKAWR
jgi:tetratricopeptide (TPR) repeat protein